MKPLFYLLWLVAFWGFTYWCTLDQALVNLTGFNILVSGTASIAGWQFLWSDKYRIMK